LVVAVVNASEGAQSLALDVEGFKAVGNGRTWALTAPNLDAQNLVGKLPQVAISEGTFDTAAKTLAAAPCSIVLYEFASV
jgi:alpha-L-arabinofuranosidase